MSAALSIRVLSARDIHELLTYERCIAAVERAMHETSAGRATLPLRQVMATPGGKGMFGMMPGALEAEASFGMKLISLYPDNPAVGLSSHMGIYVLYEAEHGRPRAILEAGALTAIRTAAASAVATRHLARQDARRLAIIGTGEEAETHLQAIPKVRDIAEVVVWGRNADKVEAFIARQATKMSIRPAASVAEAVRGADIICTVTASREPILFGHMLEPGQHVNLVGASTADAAEADGEVVRRSRFFIDYRASAMAQAGELLAALRDGLVEESHIQGEIGQVIAGDLPGRQTEADITVYKSLGIAAQDLAAAGEALRLAEAAGRGQLVEL